MKSISKPASDKARSQRTVWCASWIALITLLIYRPLVDAAALAVDPYTAVEQAGQSVEPVPQPQPHDLIVQPRDRQASLIFYRTHYLLSGTVDQRWNGNEASCDAGSTDPAFQKAVARRINYYRGMAGLAPVTFADEYNRKAQQAALITTLNGLNHKPPATARCYTWEAAQAAANSHLYIGRYGPAAIDGYIQDHDEGFHDNYHVGHRRWILLPQLQVMGTGDVPGSETLSPTNALWVVDKSIHDSRPQTREPFVAWPPPGYVPYPVVYPRWSFSYAGADFSRTTVHVTRDGEEVAIEVEPLYVWEPTEPTLVWIPLGLGSRDPWPRPEGDTTYTVTISNIQLDGKWLAISYNVIVFDPDVVTSVPSTGSSLFPFLLPSSRTLSAY